jgi:hypothetical protein
VIPAGLKDGARCESGVIAGLAGGATPTQVGSLAASRSEVRSMRREPNACHRPSQARKHRSEPEGWPAVEPEVTQPTQVGGAKPAQPEEGTQRKLQIRRWGSRRTQHRLYYKPIKIEAPGASASGVFNFGPLSCICLQFILIFPRRTCFVFPSFSPLSVKRMGSLRSRSMLSCHLVSLSFHPLHLHLPRGAR